MDKEVIPPPDKRWFQSQLAQRDISQRKLAGLLGVDPATITYTLNGTRRLSLSELKKVSDILSLPVDVIMRRWGFPDLRGATVQVPVTGYVHDDCSLITAAEPFATVEAPPEMPSDGYALQIRSARVGASLWDGVVCFFWPGTFSPTEAVGRMARVITTDGKSYFGVLRRGYEDDKFNIDHPEGGTRLENLTLSFASPTRWFRTGR